MDFNRQLLLLIFSAICAEKKRGKLKMQDMGKVLDEEATWILKNILLLIKKEPQYLIISSTHAIDNTRGFI